MMEAVQHRTPEEATAGYDRHLGTVCLVVLAPSDTGIAHIGMSTGPLLRDHPCVMVAHNGH